MVSSTDRAFLYYRKESFGCIVFNPLSGAYINLGGEAAELFIQSVTVNHSPPNLVLPGSLNRAILGDEPCINWVATEIRYKGPAVPGLSVPIKAFINVTKRCNLYCAHCYNSSGEIDSPELEAEDIETVLRHLSSCGIFKVTIAGGEPLFHREIDRVLSYMDSSDISFSLITNGIPLTEKICSRFESIENLRSITVSIDGGNAKDNDSLRGRGSFDKAITNLRLLRSVYSRELCVRATITAENAERLSLLPSLLSELEIRHLKINRLNPYGRASKSPLVLASDDYSIVRDEIIEMGAALGISVEIPSYKYQSNVDGTVSLCKAGEETFEIDADGSVFPCSFAFGHFLAGNVRTDPFDSILLNLQKHSINNPVCLSCRGRGGTIEKTVGFVPKLIYSLSSV